MELIGYMYTFGIFVAPAAILLFVLVKIFLYYTEKKEFKRKQYLLSLKSADPSYSYKYLESRCVQQHQHIIKKLNKKIAEERIVSTKELELDQILQDMYYESKKNKENNNFNNIASKFLDLLVLSNDPNIACHYLALALEVYELPLIPCELGNSFDNFHKKYGDCVLANSY
jgi:hypothetical protein